MFGFSNTIHYLDYFLDGGYPDYSLTGYPGRGPSIQCREGTIREAIHRRAWIYIHGHYAEGAILEYLQGTQCLA
jgi:hypothetical protein